MIAPRTSVIENTLALASVETFRNQIIECDALELCQSLPPASVDMILTDPPYGMGYAEWDKPVENVPELLAAFWRVLKPDGFFAFTIVMPYMMDWLVPLQSSEFRFFEHVVRLRRQIGAFGNGLTKGHESLWIYAKGSPKYCETKGSYSDVRIPGLMFDAISIEGIQRYISELRSEALNGGKRKKAVAGNRHIAHERRGLSKAPWKTEEIVNFTTVWSYLPEQRTTTKQGIDHPTVKPVRFFDRAIRLMSRPGAIVLDPFSGSGTTALAAKISGRDFICGDTSAEYVELARRRANPEFGNVVKRIREPEPLEDLPLFAGVTK